MNLDIKAIIKDFVEVAEALHNAGHHPTVFLHNVKEEDVPTEVMSYTGRSWQDSTGSVVVFPVDHVGPVKKFFQRFRKTA